MKKTLLLIFFIILIYVIVGNVVAKEQLIPDDAIRIRVIANSNSDYDQNIKLKVKDTLQKDMYKLLENAKNVDEARSIINKNLYLVEKDIDKTLQKEEYPLPFSINLLS